MKSATLSLQGDTSPSDKCSKSMEYEVTRLTTKDSGSPSRKRKRTLSESDLKMPLIIRDHDSQPVINGSSPIINANTSGSKYSTMVLSRQAPNGIDLIQNTDTGSQDVQVFPVARLPKYMDARKINATIVLPTKPDHQSQVQVILNPTAQRTYCSDEASASSHLPAVIRKDKRMLEYSRIERQKNNLVMEEPGPPGKDIRDAITAQQQPQLLKLEPKRISYNRPPE